MATVKKTGATSVKVAKPKFIFATLLTKGESGAYEKSDTTYQFEHILRDSTSLTQGENKTDAIENEVSDEAIMQNVTLGAWQFTTTIEDIQKDLVKDMCGFTVDGEKVYAPASYTERFAEIAVVLDAGTDAEGEQKYVAYVVPKLQLNTRLILESLSTSMAGFTLAGTAQSTEMTIAGSRTVRSPMYIDMDYTLPTSGVGG